jgi:succinoglycan biosynthesis protein ExoM
MPAPQILRRWLTAISKLTRPEGADLSVIIVDNEAAPNNRPIVEEFGAVHVHEPRRGITNARNAAVEAALRLEPDFIAFTDDDCEPTENWLCDMLEAQQNHDTDIVRGRTVYTYPAPLPRWILKPAKPPRAKTKPARREKPLFVGCNNVLFSSRLVRRNGLNLRFDARFNLTGGEDTDFFTRAWERGAHIVASDAPLIFEEVPAERCTFWRQVRRQHQFATGNTVIDLDRNRHLTASLGALGRLFSGLGSFIAAMVLGLFSARRFRKHALRAGKKLMYAAGQVSVLAGYRYQGYRAIDGG